jgi:hypothetical protein
VRTLACSALALAVGGALLAAQEQAPASYTRNSYYRAGERVEVPAGVNGDVVVAGRAVSIANPVTGDVLAAGWRVNLTADADDDVRMAGGELLVDSRVAGDLTIAGRDVTLGAASHVLGNSWVTGQRVRVNGVTERELRVAAQSVTIAGEIRRPTRIIAESLEVLPGARVLAPLAYEGTTPAYVAPGALVTQGITYRNIPPREAQQARSPSGLSGIVFTIHLFVGGLLLFLLVPRVATAPAETLRAQPWRSLGIGFALTIGVPLVALLFVVSLVGIPVGITVGALYLAALFLAVLTTAFTVGNYEARLMQKPIATRSRQALFLLAGVVTLAILRSLPVIGWFVVFASVLFGFGAIGLWVYRSYTHAPVHA